MPSCATSQALAAEVRGLRAGADAQQATITALRAEMQALRDELRA